MIQAVQNNAPVKLNKLIKRGGNVNLHDSYGWSATMMAANWGHFECLKVCVAHK